MLKAYFYLCLLLFSISSISYGGNFYIGIGTGLDSTNFHKYLHIVQVNGNEVYYKDDNLSGNGAYIFGFIGYKWIINKFILSTELATQLSSLKYHGYVNDHYGNHEISRGDFTINKAYGLSLLPGYLIKNNTVFFGRIGMIKGNFKYWEFKIKPSGTTGITETEWLNGIQYGIGIETSLAKNLQLRLEYIYTAYQTYIDNAFRLAPDLIRTIKLTPTSNQIALSLLYDLYN